MIVAASEYQIHPRAWWGRLGRRASVCMFFSCLVVAPLIVKAFWILVASRWALTSRVGLPPWLAVAAIPDTPKSHTRKQTTGISRPTPNGKSASARKTGARTGSSVSAKERRCRISTSFRVRLLVLHQNRTEPELELVLAAAAGGFV